MSEALTFVHTKLVRDAWLSPERFIRSPEEAVSVFQELIGDLDREMSASINLSTRGQVINASFVSMGTINTTILAPPEVLRTALLSGASKVIVLHNHPSGDVTPSDLDRMAAGRLAAAGRIVGVELVDFLVVTDKEAYSFKAMEPESIFPEEGTYTAIPEAAEAEGLEEEKNVYGAYERLKESRRSLVDSLLSKIRDGEAFFTPLWSSLAVSPRNPISGAVYQGGNRLILLNRAIDAGYRDPRWMTFNQLSQKGYAVKKGERGTRLEKWVFSKREKETDAAGRTTYKEVPLTRPFPYYFTVFNAEQVEGFPPFERESPLYHIPGDPCTEEIIDSLIKSSSCPVHETAQDRSFYAVKTDEIFLPLRSVFKSMEAFGHVAAHEMVHSTGHASRLMRTFGSRDPFLGPDENYCVEELRAELGSLFLTADLGIMDPDFDITNSAAYIEHYLDRITDTLEKNPNVLFRAAADAEKACSFLRKNLEKVLTLEKTKEDIPEHSKKKQEQIPEEKQEAPDTAAFSL